MGECQRVVGAGRAVKDEKNLSVFKSDEKKEIVRQKIIEKKE